jgi:hypothetical protein
MRTIVLLIAIAVAAQAFGAQRAYAEWNSNSNGSYRNNNGLFHIDNTGFNNKQPQNIAPLFKRAHEIIDSNNFDKEKCIELKEISWKLQTFWINANYDDRKKIDAVRTVTEKNCGKL